VKRVSFGPRRYSFTAKAPTILLGEEGAHVLTTWVKDVYEVAEPTPGMIDDKHGS
jgi:hypothetical protein